MKKIFVIVLLLAMVIPIATSAEGADPLFLLNAECNPAGSGCNVSAGWTGPVVPDTVISGDVRINEVPLYDTLQETGLLVVIPISTTAQYTMTAEWGAFVKNEARFAEQMAKDMMVNGCGLPTGCKQVKTVDLTLSNLIIDLSTQ